MEANKAYPYKVVCLGGGYFRLHIRITDHIVISSHIQFA